MMSKSDAIDLAIDEHGCTGSYELMDAIYDSIGSCEECKHRDDNYFCYFLVNSINIKPKFFCAGFEKAIL